MSYPYLAAILAAYMFLLWALRPILRNDGLVDFGWPSSFTVLAFYFLAANPAGNVTGTVYCAFFLVCGVRFMAGWLERTVRHGEDPRWQLWRARWAAGQGLFRIKNAAVNFLAFYSVQQLANVTLIAWTMYMNVRAPVAFGLLHALAVAVWMTALALETWADFDLWRFKRNLANKGKTCRVRLWKYSRHPNYFFEFVLWIAYALYSLPAAETLLDYVCALGLVPMAYWFLVHFTGIPLTEQRSLLSRGADYAAYQAATNKFFPWFPR
jgi:steroid 5-alpha reductase family enzyme